MSTAVPLDEGHDEDQLATGRTSRRGTSHSQFRPKYNGSPSSPPFLPRDVFRLIVRLESRKSRNAEVDTRSLEQAFHVPRGFSDDSGVQVKREHENENPTGPGPGAYEIPDSWETVGSPSKFQHGMSTFLSKTQRATFQSSSILSGKACEVTVNPSSFEHALKSNARSPSKVFISSVDRRLCLIPKSKDQPHPLTSAGSHSGTFMPDVYENCPRTKTSVGPAFPFPRAERSFEVLSTGACTSPEIGPARYNVRRMWEAKGSNRIKSDGNVMSEMLEPLEDTQTKVETTTPAAVFGASTAPREIMWSPVYRPFSNALPEGFEASEHYQRQKTKVLQEDTPNKKKLTSTPKLSKVRLKDLRNGAAARLQTSFDPFDWLRQRPQGAERANLLAAQYGLTEFVRNEPHAVHRQQREQEQNEEESHEEKEGDGDNWNMDECQVSEDLSDEDGDDKSPRQSSLIAMDEMPVPTEERISVSFRLPNGMIILTRLLPSRKVKSIKHRLWTRHRRILQGGVTEFQLYYQARRLPIEESLLNCQVQDKSVLQVVLES